MSDKRLLRTHQISAEIIELINEAKDHCYLVTPYYDPWTQLNRALENAAAQKKKITFVVRSGEEGKYHIKRLWEEFNFEVFIYDYLHMKFFINENKAIISTLNLLDSSNVNNLELAYVIDIGVKDVKEEVLFNYLFASKPRHYHKGYFENEYQIMKENEVKLESLLKDKGYCVICGKRIEYHMYSDLSKPVVVRCKKCWLKDQNPDVYRFPIKYCHLCGEKFDGYLNEPLHRECSKRITDLL